MNSRDRVRLALTCQRPDRIPKVLAFWEESLPAIAPAVPADYFGLDVRFADFEPPADQDDFLRYLEQLPPDVYVGDLAQLKTYHAWGYHPAAGPLQRLSAARTLAGLAGAVSPRLAEPGRHDGLAKQVAAWRAQGLAVAGGPPHLGGELFETAYRLRGFEEFLLDLAARKSVAHYLLDQLMDVLIENVVLLAQAGVDVLLLDDDVAMPTGLIVGPATWREFFKPRLAQIIRTARAIAPDLIVFYHSAGDFTRLIPDLLEIGVNVVNPLQPDCMDAAAIKREFGDRLALWGTVGTAALWDHGTADQIRAEVRHRIETLGPAGLLLAPAYDLDFAPFVNIVAFCEAVDEFGRL